MSRSSEKDDLLFGEKRKKNRNVIMYSDSDLEYEKDINMNIEQLDDTLDDSCENRDWKYFNEDESESEIEECKTEVNEDSKRWGNDGD